MSCEIWNSRLIECARSGQNPDAALEEHLSTCGRCVERLEAERTLTRQLRIVRVAVGMQRRPESRRDEVLRAFEPQRSRWVPVPWIAAIAAMLLFGLVLIRSWQRPAEIQEEMDLEASAGFVPIPFAPPLASGEFVRVVHEEIPASDVASMGLDVETQYASAIPVDLIVGEDGLPRAVRISGEEAEN